MSAQPPSRLTPVSATSPDVPQRPEPTALQSGPHKGTEDSTATIRPNAAAQLTGARKKRNHRGGKKKRARKQSFAASTEDGSGMLETPQPHRNGQAESAARSSFYRLDGRNLSNTSIESEALLDHR